MIVDDWTSGAPLLDAAGAAGAGVRSSLAVPIAGKERPFGVLDIHSTEPSRFTPQDVHFVQASANVLADALERHNADEALRHRVLHDSLTGLPNRLASSTRCGTRCVAAPPPARRSACSSSTSTTSS